MKVDMLESYKTYEQSLNVTINPGRAHNFYQSVLKANFVPHLGIGTYNLEETYQVMSLFAKQLALHRRWAYRSFAQVVAKGSKLAPPPPAKPVTRRQDWRVVLEIKTRQRKIKEELRIERELEEIVRRKIDEDDAVEMLERETAKKEKRKAAEENHGNDGVNTLRRPVVEGVDQDVEEGEDREVNELAQNLSRV